MASESWFPRPWRYRLVFPRLRPSFPTLLALALRFFVFSCLPDRPGLGLDEILHAITPFPSSSTLTPWVSFSTTDGFFFFGPLFYPPGTLAPLLTGLQPPQEGLSLWRVLCSNGLPGLFPFDCSRRWPGSPLPPSLFPNLFVRLLPCFPADGRSLFYPPGHPMINLRFSFPPFLVSPLLIF